MKHIQVIDSALNCSYSICECSEEDFALIFPKAGQDIEFIEELAKRVGKKAVGEIVLRSTTRRVNKPTLKGLHGTLFFGLPQKKIYYPNKREDDFDHPNLELILANPRNRQRKRRSV